MILRFVMGLVVALSLAGCGGGGDGGDETVRPVFPAGGVREADGTMAYCGDFQLVEWPPFRFENNTWGKGPITDGGQCIVAREGAMGTEFGWRWDWPLGDEFGFQHQPKGYPEIHYGLKPFFNVPSSTPAMPIRISEIQEMTVRYAVDMTAQGIYNLAFDMLLSPDDSFEIVSHEIMVWVHRSEGIYGVSGVIDSVTIDGVAYNFHRQDNFDSHGTTRPPDEIPDYTNSIQQFIGPEGQFIGTLDLAKFYDWLVDEGHVDSSYYVTVIEFGNEVIEGSGETWLREYEVTVR